MSMEEWRCRLRARHAKFISAATARLSFCEQTAYNLGNEFIAWETLL